MIMTSENAKRQSTEEIKPLFGDISLFGSLSFFFMLTSILFFSLIFYHASLRLESRIIEDKANLYKTAIFKSFSLEKKISSENIIQIQKFVLSLKSADAQLSAVEVFTKDGLIVYSSALGLIGDHVLNTWHDLIDQNLTTNSLSGNDNTAFFFPVPSTDYLYLSLTFKHDSFFSHFLKNKIIIGLATLVSFGFGIYLFGNQIRKLRHFDFSNDPLLIEFEKSKVLAQDELNTFSKDLKDYETL